MWCVYRQSRRSPIKTPPVRPVGTSKAPAPSYPISCGRSGARGRDVDPRSSPDRYLLNSGGELDLAFEQRELLLEVVAVWTAASATGHVHVDRAVTAGRILAGRRDRIGVADHTDTA